MPKDFDVQGSVANVWGARTQREEPTPRRFDQDRYARGGLLGEGGMGRVFIARDLLLDRDVALKECRPELGAPGRERLAHEARITARLEHPNILPIYDAGDDDEGTNWFVTRLVRGQPLGSRIRGVPLAERLDALRPVLAATEAVAFAHSRDVVHRDLKPDNILVGAFGETLVADWGLAAELEDGRAVDAGRVGTAGYMAPEQASGTPATPAADVFALGVVLFELATGADVTGGDPGPDSEAGTSRLRASGAPGELAGIVTKATAPDPTERYPTAEELARDLDALLAGRRVSAHDYSAMELLGRLVRLWKAPLTVAGIAALLLGAAIVVGLVRTDAQRQRAERESLRAQEEAEQAARSAATALLEQARSAVQAGAFDRADALAHQSLTYAPGDPGALGLLAAQALRDRPVAQVVASGVGGCDAAALLPDGVACLIGTRLSLRSAERTVWTRDLAEPSRLLTSGGALYVAATKLLELDPATGATVATWDQPEGAEGIRRRGALGVAWHDSDLQVLLPGATPERGETRAAGWCEGASDVAGVAFGDQRLLVVCSDLRYGLVEPTAATALTARLRQSWAGDGLEALVHLGDDRFAMLGASGAVTILDARESYVVAHHPLASSALVEGVVQGDLLAVRSARGEVYVLDLGLGSRQRLPVEGVRDLAFLSNGGLEVLTDAVSRWTLAGADSGWQVRVSGGVSSVEAHPTTGRIAIAQGNGGVALWTPGAPLAVTRVFGGVVKNAVWDGDEVLAAASVLTAPSVARIDLDGVARPTAHASPWRRVGVVAGWGGVGLSWSETQNVVALDAGATPARWGDEHYVALATDGASFAVRARDGAVAFAEVEGGAPVVRWREDAGGDGALAVHRRGSAATGSPGRVRVLGEARRDFDHPERVTALAFSPSGGRLAAGALDGTVRVWRLGDGALLLAHAAHEGRVSGLTFRGEDELVSGGWDRTARRWDLSVAAEGGPAAGVPGSPPQGP